MWRSWVCCLVLLCWTLAAAATPYSGGLETDLIFKKPYETVWEREADPERPPEPVSDQTEPACPLPLGSSSQLTGCTCNVSSQLVRCVYTDRLASVPEFVDPVRVLLPSSSAVGQHEWAINLRCRNFSVLADFRAFRKLRHIQLLDLSAATRADDCKRSDWTLSELMGARNNASSSFRPVLLTEIGTDANIYLSQPKSNLFSLVVKKLDLNSNRISSLHLNRLTVNNMRIKSIDLANNSLQGLLLTPKLNIDVCYMDLAELNLAHNGIHQIDLGFLIFLRNLNLSANYLTRFSIETFDTPDFKEYYNQTCGMKVLYSNALHGNVTRTTVIYRSNLADLDLSHNLLTSVPFGNLYNVLFGQLATLSLRNNRLRRLAAHEFAQARLLRHLDLAENAIEALDAKLFAGLVALKHLDLSGNALLVLAPALFANQERTLEYLNVDHNQLVEVPVDTLRHCGSVRALHLSYNRFRRVRNFSFGYMALLHELYLAHNAIEVIEPKAFYIDERSILGPGLVEKLDLSSNRIDSLNSSIFHYLTNLRYLLLSNNRIRHVDFNAFRGIHHLISLDLSLNAIRHTDFLYNRNFSAATLRFLKLSNNEITQVKPGQFAHLANLAHLDLSANRIRHLADCAFAGLELSIKKLLLNYNHIAHINSCTFSVHFRHLRFVQIMHNPINCSNNCDFFFAVYNYPYSISYHGIECVNGTNNNVVDHRPKGAEAVHCTRDQYEHIYQRCRQNFARHNCTAYAAARGANETTSGGMDYVDEGAEDSAEGRTDTGGGGLSGGKVDKLLVKSDAYHKNGDVSTLRARRGSLSSLLLMLILIDVLFRSA